MKKIIFIFIAFVTSCFFTYVQGYDYPYNALENRDPLRPLITTGGNILIKDKKDITEIFLQGIFYSTKESSAVINNEIFYEGDQMGDYIMKKIEPNRVILDKQGRTHIIKWEETDED